MLLLVPFNTAWITHDKIDIKAIYRRPRFVEDEYGELKRELVDGLPTWDITTPLPVKQHNKWIQKGFEYITLADRNSLVTAGRANTVLLPQGGTDMQWTKYDQHTTGGPWNYRMYAEGQKVTTTAATEQIRVDVEKYGSEVVTAIRRQVDPKFELPPSLQGIPPGGHPKEATAKREKVAS